MRRLENNHLSCCFDDQGQLLEIRRDGLSLPFKGFGFDFGCDEEMVTGLMEYESMLEFRTWNLPTIKPTGKAFDLAPASVRELENGLDVTYRLPKTDVTVGYRLESRWLKVDITIQNTTDAPLYLNTCAFMPKLAMTRDVVFDFPANAPIWHCHSAELKELEAVQTGLINCATVTALPGGHMDLLFIDKVEKHGCGAYRQGDATHYVYDAGLEMDLKAGEAVTVGSLYIAPCAENDGDPYLLVRSIIAELGYAATAEGITEGVMYSCHPYGTMDAGFNMGKDLYQYAEDLPKLKAIQWVPGDGKPGPS